MTKKEKEGAQCSFCGRPGRSCRKIDFGTRILYLRQVRTPMHGNHREKTGPSRTQTPQTPRDQNRPRRYVIGQEKAKKTISVAVYNHYKRIRALHKENEGRVQQIQRHALGPTGSGKTLMARTLANILDESSIREHSDRPTPERLPDESVCHAGLR